MEKKKFVVPHVYILLLALILLFSLLSYIIPSNVYDYHDVVVNPETGQTRSVVDPETYHAVDPTPVSLMQFLTAVPRGMQESAQIIFFIFIVGGAMAVLQETRAIEAGMGRMIKAMKSKTLLLIPIVMFLFSLCGSVFGMAEETIPFIPIFVSLMIAAGYDSITGVAIVFCGASAGFAGAFINPFTIQVAQGIAQLPLLSGMTFRIVMYICMVLLTTITVMLYATKVKKNPQLSPMYEFDQTREDVADLDSLPTFGGREKAILLVFLASIILLIFGVIKKGWYMDEIAALFFGMSMIVAAIGKLGINGYANALAKGMADIAGGALVVGFARGILIVMNDANILHTILHGAAGLLQGLPGMVSAVGMYIFQCLLNFIVPSGSGQAALTMPIMAPLADLVGVERQVAVVAYQLGDAFTNFIVPTSGCLLGALAAAKLDWGKWAKFQIKFQAVLFAFGSIAVILAVVIGLS